MTDTNSRTECEILEYIKGNLKSLLRPRYGKEPNSGIAQYDLVKRFPNLSANTIRDYLIDLERKGKLKMVEERGDDLRLYVPVSAR